MTLVKRIVEGYETNGFNLSGTNISMDRYYTSIPITEWLYEKKITCIATINSNRKGLPIEMKEIKGREENSWMACKIDGGEIIINSYVVKTKRKSLICIKYMILRKIVLTFRTSELGHIPAK